MPVFLPAGLFMKKGALPFSLASHVG